MLPIAISLGDPAGIGPELLNKSLDHLGPSLIFGAQLYCPSPLPAQCQWIPIPTNESVTIGKPNAESGRQAYNSFKKAAEAVKQGKCRALVTLPLAKEYVALSQPGFHGHTDELNLWWGGQSLMTLIGGDLKVALVTDHEALIDVPSLITTKRVLQKARTLRQNIKRYFTKDKEPQLHLLGLNPHAGENGLIGHEEALLNDALEVLTSEGGNWQGPWPADAFFAHHSYGDGVLAMYHDQGLIPVKMLGKKSGVHITLGLPFIRSSPDHGTAFDIAGQNKADPSSFIEALRLAQRL